MKDAGLIPPLPIPAIIIRNTTVHTNDNDCAQYNICRHGQHGWLVFLLMTKVLNLNNRRTRS